MIRNKTMTASDSAVQKRMLEVREPMYFSWSDGSFKLIPADPCAELNLCIADRRGADP